MVYHQNLLKFFFSMDDHLYRIRKAETVNHVRKWCLLLCLFSIIIYGWMASLGIGSDFISSTRTGLSMQEYESSKLDFVIGRCVYAVLLTAVILFLSALLFYAVFDIPFWRLLVMQQAVLFIMLLERIVWVPLMLIWGLDWYVSPLSFGIIASYLTGNNWIIFFFGAISIVQLWIIWFQVKYLRFMSSYGKGRVWLMVILLHLFYWIVAATVASVDNHLLRGWFG